MARIDRRLVCGSSISKRGLFLLEGVVTISFPLLFSGVATPVVAVADFLVLELFVGAFAFAFVPLEEREEGFLAVRRDGFFWGDSSSLLSALGLRRDTLGIVIVHTECASDRDSAVPILTLSIGAHLPGRMSN